MRLVSNADVEAVSTGGGALAARDHAVRERAREVIDRLLPSPQAPLLNGIIS